MNKKSEILAPKVSVSIDDPRINTVIVAALHNGWPVLLHYEFRAMEKSRKLKRLNHLEAVLKQHPNQSFMLMHMGQLDSNEVRSLLERYKNIYFQLSMTTNVYRRSHYPWTYMFVESGPPGALHSY